MTFSITRYVYVMKCTWNTPYGTIILELYVFTNKSNVMCRMRFPQTKEFRILKNIDDISSILADWFVIMTIKGL